MSKNRKVWSCKFYDTCRKWKNSFFMFNLEKWPYIVGKFIQSDHISIMYETPFFNTALRLVAAKIAAQPMPFGNKFYVGH